MLHHWHSPVGSLYLKLTLTYIESLQILLNNAKRSPSKLKKFFKMSKTCFFKTRYKFAKFQLSI